MKALTKSVLTFLLPVIAPVFLQGAGAAQVISEDPDGATFDRGAVYGVSVGMELMAGDSVSTEGSTLILSLGGGSLLTIYPNSEVEIISASNGAVSLRLVRGEILGDASAGFVFTVVTNLGTATISDGVYGIVHTSSEAAGWDLQIRNLDGSVSFTGDNNLDTTNVTASIVEPGQEISIPAGEEMTLQGVYNESSDAFALLEGGATIAVLDNQTQFALREQQEAIAGVARAFEQAGQAPAPAVIIELPPVEGTETASDRG